MKATPTRLPEVLLLEPRRFHDERGWFMETYRADVGPTADLPPFVQDNHSRSAAGVLRGLHYQLRHPQGKLVRVPRGAAFDVALDIRPDSATFGQWAGARLDADNGAMLWVPPGFAHGFLALEDDTDLLYKCTTAYRGDDERGIRYDDPAIGIDWPMQDVLVSPRDAQLPLLADADLP